MSFSPINYALSKKLDNAILSGVVSHSVDNVNKTITFTFNDGTSSTIQFDNPTDGKDGVGIAAMYKDTNNHLIVSLSDGSIIDVGELPVGSVTGPLKEITNITYLDSKLTFTFSDGSNKIVNIIPKLTELSDVSISSPTSGQVLVYNGATNKFINSSISTTDQYVKMTSTDTTGSYLADLIDNDTLVNNNNKLEVNKIKGQQITVDELNTLLGMDANVKDSLNALSTGGMVFKDVVPTKADLPQGALNGFVYIVNSDESDNGNRNAYIYSDVHGDYVLVGSSGLEVRNFTTNPINLESEVTGILPTSKIDTTGFVNKATDVVSSLTYPIPDDDLNKIGDLNVLKQINTEVANALNNKVDKSAITTVIDNTVTDEQVASAKSVYTNILSLLRNQNKTEEQVNSNIETFYIGTISSDVGQAIGLPLTNGIYSKIINIPHGMYTIQLAWDIGNRNNIFMIRKCNNGVWEQWQKVCTTSVADVPRKRMTFSNETYCKPINSDEGVNYEVKNGICFVYVKITNTLTSTDLHYKTFCTGLPKPSINIGFSVNDRDFKGSGVSLALTLNGEMQIICTDTTNVGKYYTTLSYPVAE